MAARETTDRRRAPFDPCPAAAHPRPVVRGDGAGAGLDLRPIGPETMTIRGERQT